MSETIKTLAELQAASQAASAAGTRLTYLFDEGKYTELDAYAGGSEQGGVITAFGYADGEPVYAFSQNMEVRKGAMTKVCAGKIAKIYDLAAKTGAPVVGIYDSYGADVEDGAQALAAYGELMACVAELSGVVPQIAVVAGVCSGSSAMLAASADFTVIAKEGSLYVAPNSDANGEDAVANGTACAVCEDDKAAVEKAREILLKLPQNNLSPAPVYEFEEPANVSATAEGICDEGSVMELSEGFGKAAYTALGSVNGSTVGVVATDKTQDKLTADDCTKIARFVRVCDSFGIPVITLVDTAGFEADGDSEVKGAVRSMAKLSHAYAEATTVKISVVKGKAYGPAYIALAGKGSNSDVSYALPEAVISPLDPVTAVEFLEHDKLKGAEDLTTARNALADEYAKTKASAAYAASKGCVDGVVEVSSLRQTLVAALDMMSGKRISRLPKKHSNIQL